MLDEELHSSGTPEEHARAGGAEFTEYLSREPEWERLFFEFAVQAARDETFREQLLARWSGSSSASPPPSRTTSSAPESSRRARSTRFALMIFTMSNGVALQRLLDPEGVPDDLLSDMLELLTLGALAKAQAEA